MGIAGLNVNTNELIIYSHIITYGNKANPEITEQIREEIETMWNEPQGILVFSKKTFKIIFSIISSCAPGIEPLEIYQNLDPRNNYFRIEEFADGNISFVDGIGCNTGYFKTENLYKGSTTAAHEYGHTLGLEHPQQLDIRGEGVPGIMYPRGTLVDPQFQYDPTKPAGVTGGTMYPMFRKVKQKDIDSLGLPDLAFKNNTAVIGEFTNVYHRDHAEISPEEFMQGKY